MVIRSYVVGNQEHIANRKQKKNCPSIVMQERTPYRRDRPRHLREYKHHQQNCFNTHAQPPPPVLPRQHLSLRIHIQVEQGGEHGGGDELKKQARHDLAGEECAHLNLPLVFVLRRRHDLREQPHRGISLLGGHDIRVRRYDDVLDADGSIDRWMTD